MNDRIAQDIEATREDVEATYQHFKKWGADFDNEFLVRLGMAREYGFNALMEIRISGGFLDDAAGTIGGKCGLQRFRLQLLRAATVTIGLLEALDERYPGLRDE